MKVHSLSLWERVGVRGYGPCLKGLRALTRPTSLRFAGRPLPAGER